MTNLDQLDLSHNNLQVLSSGMLTGLKLNYLFLDSNPQLTLRMTAFQGMTTRVLSMNNCNLKAANPDMFQPLGGSLHNLMLSGNRISRFDKSMLTVFEPLELLRIDNNPLICDCESRWLKEYYDLNKAKVTAGLEEPRCAAPANIAGSFFNRLSVFDFSCIKPTLSANVSFTDNKGVLSCVARGHPLPQVSWYRPNGVVSHSQPRPQSTVNTNEIELLASEADVAGQYSCVASNDAGNISFTVNIDWPFHKRHSTEAPQPCVPTGVTSTQKNPHKVITDVIPDNLSRDSTTPEQDVFKLKYFTLVDLVAAILGTFTCTLVVTVITLHFCVYRRRGNSDYATPPMSEYSSNSSNGCDKNQCTTPAHYPLPQLPQHRPLPLKPYHKIYDEHHYMATSLDERDDFLRAQGTQGRITPSCDSCPACQTLNSATVTRS